jgi:hypothetical protein
LLSFTFALWMANFPVQWSRWTKQQVKEEKSLLLWLCILYVHTSIIYVWFDFGTFPFILNFAHMCASRKRWEIHYLAAPWERFSKAKMRDQKKL